jgi:hypothetical protein
MFPKAVIPNAVRNPRAAQISRALSVAAIARKDNAPAVCGGIVLLRVLLRARS